MTSRRLQIVNEKGLHARASGSFVKAVEAFDASVTVSKDGMSVSGDSIMGLLMLGASKGSFIEVEASGTQARELVDALEALIADRFGEEF